MNDLIYPEWIKVDPDAAIAAIKSEPARAGLADASLEALLKSADLTDPALKARLDALMDAGARLSLTENEISEKAARTAEERAGRYLLLPPGRARNLAIGVAAAALAQQDFAGAQKFIASLPAAEQAAVRAQALQAVLACQGNMLATSRGSWSSISGKDAMVRMRENIRLAAAEARAWLADGADPRQRSLLGPLLAERMAEMDPTAALKWSWDNLSGSNLTKSIATVAESQAAADLPAARALVESLPPGGLQASAAVGVARTWIKSAPEAALRWLLASEAAEPGAAGSWWEAGNLLETWTRENPALARDFLAGSVGLLSGHRIEGVAGSMADKDPIPTANWAASLPSGPVRDTFVNRSVAAWGARAPEAAAAWLADSNAATPQAHAALFSAWHQQDPAAAAKWAGLLPPGPSREAALSGLRTRAMP